jgi:Baseplate hub gp41
VIFGMDLTQINALTKAGLVYAAKPGTPLNQMTIEAGDTNTEYQTVFSGIIVDAAPQFNRQPQVAFVVTANSLHEMQLNPVAPNSFNGSADVADVMKSLARTAGLTLENNGVSVKLVNPYFPGGIIDQITSCARAANINWHIDPVAGVLAIWPVTGFRHGSAVNVSPEAGMIGYPEFSQALVHVRTLFNPALKTGVQMMIRAS